MKWNGGHLQFGTVCTHTHTHTHTHTISINEKPVSCFIAKRGGGQGLQPEKRASFVSDREDEENIKIYFILSISATKAAAWIGINVVESSFCLLLWKAVFCITQTQWD